MRSLSITCLNLEVLLILIQVGGLGCGGNNLSMDVEPSEVGTRVVLYTTREQILFTYDPYS